MNLRITAFARASCLIVRYPDALIGKDIRKSLPNAHRFQSHISCRQRFYRYQRMGAAAADVALAMIN